MASETPAIHVPTDNPSPVTAPELTETGRSELIEKLSSIVPYVDTATWAMLWLADLEQIRYLSHIYPSSMMTRPQYEQNSFWFNLSCFWEPETVERWKKVLQGPEGTEVLQNKLCLSRDCHVLWEKARFALQPVEISEDIKVLKLSFFWLPVMKYSKIIALTTRPFLPSDLKHIGEQTKLFNCETAAQVCSGDIITMETLDPDTHPLPSIEILNMQWVLTRALAISGAADVTLEAVNSDWEEDTESDD